METTWEIQGTFESPDSLACERRQETRVPLMLAGWIWRKRAPERAIAIRLLDHADQSVGFICPVGMAEGEVFELSLERRGPRYTGMQVMHCESLSEDTFCVGACKTVGGAGGTGV